MAAPTLSASLDPSRYETIMLKQVEDWVDSGGRLERQEQAEVLLQTLVELIPVALILEYQSEQQPLPQT
jgi:hypothetical protein